MSEKVIFSPEADRQEDIDRCFAYWASTLDSIEASIDTYAGTGDIPGDSAPEGWQPIWDVKKLIDNEAFFTLENVTRYFEYKVREAELDAMTYGREPRYHAQIMDDLLYTFEDRSMGAVVLQEDAGGILHQALLDAVVRRNAEGDALNNYLVVLKDMYGFESSVQLFSLKGGEFDERICEELKKPNAVKWMSYLDIPYSREDDWIDSQKKYRRWMMRGLQSYLGINDTEAYNYVFSAGTRWEEVDLLDIIEKFDHFGIDRIRQISKATGIYGLEAYSIAQLERMADFAEDPRKVSEKLENSDVVAVMINRVGDHNGVMHKTAYEVDDTDRVLFFEINNLGDIYRRMINISSVGIRPSTLILAAHSNKGRFVVSDDREPGVRKWGVATIATRRAVELVNSSSDRGLNPLGQRGYSMHGMKGMARLVNDFMRPSRSINDDPSDVGRRKVIFQACYAGTETGIKDVDGDGGDFVSSGEASVIGRLAEDLKAMGFDDRIDVYGAPEGIQMHKTKTGLGLQYTIAPEGMGLDRRPTHAIRVRLEHGKVYKTAINEIPMRKAV
ncbi:MAG: hypothetical protein U0520_00395 [Candidatus Saccharimonadales bacterium]